MFLRQIVICFENMKCSCGNLTRFKEINYLLPKIWSARAEIWLVPRKIIIITVSELWSVRVEIWMFPRQLIICFENMKCSCENTTRYKKSNCLLWKFEVFVRSDVSFQDKIFGSKIWSVCAEIWLVSRKLIICFWKYEVFVRKYDWFQES